MSATRSKIWTNLDFEYELRHGEAWQPPRAVARVMDAWSTLLRCMPGHEDAIPWDGHSRQEQLMCWGESRRALVARGHTDIEARLESVEAANDKRTSDAITASERLPHAALISTIAQLHERLEACPHDWILKHPLGVSGRERIMGRAHTIEPRLTSWVRRQCDAGEQLLFEPKVAISREFSWHVHILQDGEIEVMGTCTLLTDSQGTHRGHIIEADARARALPDTLRASIEALHARTGYTGPLSSDGFEGRLGHASIYREVSEFNARLSFGRVALELTREAAGRAHMAWWHPAASDLERKGLHPWSGQRSSRGWFRLPEHIDPEGRSGSALCVWGGDEPPSASQIARSWDAL